MINIICLWIGRIILSIILITIIGILIYCFSFFFIPLRRFWYCIKRIIPCYWITEQEYQEYKRICDLIEKNPEQYKNWKIGAKIIRKNRIGNLILPNKEKWWEPKNHFYYKK